MVTKSACIETSRRYGSPDNHELRASGGFTTIVRKNSSPARSFPLLTRIRWINRCPDRPEPCPQTGKRCFTNKGRLFGAQATESDLGVTRSPRENPTDYRQCCRSFCLTHRRFCRDALDFPGPL